MRIEERKEHRQDEPKDDQTRLYQELQTSQVPYGRQGKAEEVGPGTRTESGMEATAGARYTI